MNLSMSILVKTGSTHLYPSMTHHKQEVENNSPNPLENPYLINVATERLKGLSGSQLEKAALKNANKIKNEQKSSGAEMPSGFALGDSVKLKLLVSGKQNNGSVGEIVGWTGERFEVSLNFKRNETRVVRVKPRNVELVAAGTNQTGSELKAQMDQQLEMFKAQPKRFREMLMKQGSEMVSL